MIRGSLSETARILDGNLVGPDADFRGVGTDTRKDLTDHLFVALKGPNHDGHDYLAQARDAGAVGAVVEHEAEVGFGQVTVADTLSALGRLAADWRARFGGPVVGLTGSNGKTTTRALCASVVAQAGRVMATEGNYNNEVGLPLTLFRLDPEEHDFAVLEMGANHPGEIAKLTTIAQPDVGLITNVAAAHLEGFGDLDGVARAKGELLAGLAPEAVAVINADDTYCEYWHGLSGTRRVVTYGLIRDADISARGLRASEGGGGSRFTLITPDAESEVELGLPGSHNVMNALAAAAVGHALGLATDDIARGLADARPIPGRSHLIAGPDGLHILDDCYNANPASFQVALDLLATLPGEHWVVMGDLLELGSESERLHGDLGSAARAAGVRRLFALGERSRAAVASFGPGAEHFQDIDSLIGTLSEEAGPGVSLLVKGSNAMGLERVVRALAPRAGEG